MRQVNLFNYLPLFMQEYQEMNVILKVENEELIKEWEEIERAFNNGFIFSADIYGISRFEKMMKIYPKSTESIEERQNKIYTKWNSALPYTWRWLENYLFNYFKGTTTKATPTLFNDEYRLNVKLTSKGYYKEYEYNLFENLRKLIPANLILNMTYVIPEISGQSFCKSFMVYRIKKELKQRAQNFVSNGNVYARSRIVYSVKKEMK